MQRKTSVFLKKVKNGATITITSRGRVVARLVPVEDERATTRRALDLLAQNAEVVDVRFPIDADWDAQA
ncbi:MAG: type II toxin-antitoxin system prevent-host-death family antitoxin [Desulfobacterales bacterium]|nr:type II toxin-antitoxin system prevent-host-death family antitoxin [Desulfobacterales bacterium]